MENNKHHGREGYLNLAVQSLIGGVIMYLVMFVMIDGLGSFYNNLNMFYMTIMMVAPMGVLMILVDRGMFPNKTLNAILLAGLTLAFLGAFALIRTQTTIGDRAFLRSMIPHHSGAVLMCREADLRDPEIKRLCAQIISSQKREIDQMKSMLDRL